MAPKCMNVTVDMIPYHEVIYFNSLFITVTYKVSQNNTSYPCVFVVEHHEDPIGYGKPSSPKTTLTKECYSLIELTNYINKFMTNGKDFIDIVWPYDMIETRKKELNPNYHSVIKVGDHS